MSLRRVSGWRSAPHVYVRAAARGQALVEYLLMTTMLLFLFTGLYRLLQGALKDYFTQAGKAILTAYY